MRFFQLRNSNSFLCQHRLRIESLENRQLLSGSSNNVAPVHGEKVGPMEANEELEPQYQIHQPPRLQLGNAPLIRTPQYIGMDQVDTLWQTKTVGPGTQDTFRVEYRKSSCVEDDDQEETCWRQAKLNPIVETNVDTRIVHSATLDELFWDTDYNYRVQQFRGDELIETIESTFRSRLRPGNNKPFSFAAYGDSATPSRIEDFAAVQAEISDRDLAFSLLLGDATYEFGRHEEADSRFVRSINPVAVDWTDSHIDFLAYGNHDILFVDGGYPSEDNYSTPIPVAGQNAYADAPANDRPERHYSFDYGDVHFATFETFDIEFPRTEEQIATLNARIDFVAEDLAQSGATWKIVFAHAPIAGTEKISNPGTLYFQQVVRRLNEVGADLLLVGDSHSYSWTYPIQDFSDLNGNGFINAKELVIDDEDRHEFTKGDGLIQVVAGVGGHSLRSTEYNAHYVARGFSRHEDSGPIEFGFSQIDVSDESLTVSYISSVDGSIVGDTNKNGIQDEGEEFFGQFRIRKEIPDVEPQYTMHHPPRIQPGNAPLIGTPAYDGKDQIDILWQTRSAGEGNDDGFRVRYRELGSDIWKLASLNPSIDTEQDTRIIHSATLAELDWNTQYEYRVEHLRQESIVEDFIDVFQTRLQPGDPTPFSFVSYGDSAVKRPSGDDFQRVQAEVSRQDPAFTLLLGDNFYDFGSHIDADARFHPDDSPASSYLTSHHMEYFAVGNHDVLNRDYGQASRDNFSNPIPVKGVNAFAQPIEGESDEFTFSFDYGDVHFLTIDANFVETKGGEELIRRLAGQAQFIRDDLAATTAKWKIVYMHHPMLGTDKGYRSEYLQTLIPVLNEAGVDLVLNGDSHTFSWTHPITGFDDTDNNGVIDGSEIKYAMGDTKRFGKGQGLIQLVSGLGGRSIRSDEYSEVYFAEAYSRSNETWPAEFGFAKIDVSPDELTVSYISSETGQIVGDFNQNGIEDDDEPYFGQFKVVVGESGDTNFDGTINALDIDTICSAIQHDLTTVNMDLNQDGVVDTDDVEFLVGDILQTFPGDANLDGNVDSEDLVEVFVASEYEDGIEGNSTWQTGDWNCDGEFNSSDLILVFRLGIYRE